MPTTPQDVTQAFEALALLERAALESIDFRRELEKAMEEPAIEAKPRTKKRVKR